MKASLLASPSKARQTKAQFANPEDYLSYELGKATQELPPFYTRLLAVSISVLVFGGITWAHFSLVDEVASATGKLIPTVKLRPVRSLNDGIIREVKVVPGEQVNKGDVLIVEDQAISQAEVNRLKQSARLIQEDLARLEAERTGKSSGRTSLQDQLLVARLKDFTSNHAAAEADANKQLATIQEAQTRFTRLQENLTNGITNLNQAQTLLTKAKEGLGKAQEKEKLLSLLAAPDTQAISRLEYIEAQNQVIKDQAEVTRAESEITKAQDKVISTEKDIAAQRHTIRQAQQAYQSARHQAERLEFERRSEILSRLNERREELATTTGQLEQAKKQQALEIIKTPVSGKVYEMKATKGPVQRGEELLSILPDNNEVLLEVNVLNRDIGFVNPGDRAKVKLMTFPFQEFGTIEGEVVNVSPNAVIDEENKDLGLVFKTTIKLQKQAMRVRGQDVPLVPGMTATADIVTRKKSILTFLIEPITRRFSEAFSAR